MCNRNELLMTTVAKADVYLYPCCVIFYFLGSLTSVIMYYNFHQNRDTNADTCSKSPPLCRRYNYYFGPWLVLVPVLGFLYQHLSKGNSLLHDNIAQIASITLNCFSLLVICFLLNYRSWIHSVTYFKLTTNANIYHLGLRTTLLLAIITVISRAISTFNTTNNSDVDIVFTKFSTINCISTYIQLATQSLLIDNEFRKRKQRKNLTPRSAFQKNSNHHLLHLIYYSNIALYLTDSFLHDQHERDLMIRMYGSGYACINININKPALTLYRLFSCICLHKLLNSTET